MSQFINDNPITSENIEEDAFNRNDYAKQIATSILSKELKDITVFSVEGSWGCGKSSLLNLIKHQISTIDNQATLIDFKPWHYGKNVSLQDKFIETLYANFKNNSDLAQLITKYGLSLGSTALSLLALSSPKFIYIKKLFQKIHDIYSKLSESNPTNIKDKINDELKKLTSPIVIFIDDIDRLGPDEVLEILKLVREVANFQNIKYVLAYDRSYIDQIISDANFPNPYQYLNKIINFAYPMPNISKEQYEKYFDSHLEKISSIYPELKIDDDFPMAFHYKVRVLLKTPREIKALINRIMFISANLKTEFNLSEIIQLETIFLTHPKLYEHIKSHPEAYIGFDINSPFQTKDPKEVISDYKQERIKIIESCNPNETKKKTLNRIVSDLFPHTESEKVSGTKGGYINSNDGFSKYFHFSVPKTLVPLVDVNNFFSNQHSQTILDKYIENGELLNNLMDNLVTLVESGKQELETVNIDTINNLSNLYLIESVSKFEDNNYGFLQSGPLNKAWRIILRYFQVHQERINDYLATLITEKRSLYLILELYDRFRQTISDENINDLKEYFQTSLNNLSIFNQYMDLRVFMGALEHFQDFSLEYLKSNITEEHMPRFFKCITSQGADTDKGLFVSPPHEKVYDFFDDTWLQDKTKQALDSENVFTPETLAAINAIKDKKKAYVKDFKE